MKKPNFRAIITLLSNNDPRGEQILDSGTGIDMDSGFYEWWKTKFHFTEKQLQTDITKAYIYIILSTTMINT